MMKKLLSFAVAAMMMLAVSSCGDDDDFNGNGNNNGGGKHLAKVTWVENEYSTYETRFSWDGNQLSRVEEYTNGSLDSYSNYVYSNNKLSEVITQNVGDGSYQWRVKLYYNGNKMSRIEEISPNGETSTYNVTCNNQNQITEIDFEYGTRYYTWENGNVVRIVYINSNDSQTRTFTYDDKNSPYCEDLFFEIYLKDLMSANNVIFESGSFSASSYTYTHTYTYTYTSDNYPSTRYSNTEGTWYYYYTDGTGSNYNGGSQQNYTVSVSANNSSYGYVTGGGTYPAGSTVTLTAYPYSGYQFSYWSDGSTQNPRTITVNGNVSYTAYFTTSGGGSTSVTFGSYSWGSVDPNIYYNSSYDVLYGNLYSNTSQDYPYLRLQIETPSYGTTTLIVGDNGFLEGNYNMLDYYEQTTLVDGNNNYYGDWWAKNATVQFSSLNLNAGTASLTIYATMFSAYEAYIDGDGIDGASTRSLTISLPNLTFDQAKKVMTSVQNMNRRSLALRHNMTPGRLQVKR